MSQVGEGTPETPMNMVAEDSGNESEEIVTSALADKSESDYEPSDSEPMASEVEAVLTKEVVEQERLEMERRKKSEQTRTAQLARDFKQKKETDKQARQRAAKLTHLLNQTKTYSSFLENQLLSAMKDEPAAKKRRTELGLAEPTAAAAKEAEFKQPALLSGGELRPYQLDGVQWMLSLYENGIHGILGDEMGLGKTIQTIGFLCQLKTNGVHGPFLIIAPLNTLNNWIREFHKFAPKVKTLLYHGSKQHREELRKKDMKSLRRPGDKDFDMPVIVTSYEIILRDAPFLRKYDWKILVVDEGHRLKNKDCILLRELKQYHSSNRLLLSGTPLQNSLKELWSLLHFLIPDIFQSVEDFESWFDFLEVENQGNEIEEKDHFVSKLHDILRPFLLRRVKSDVECHIPPKKEMIVYTHLTSEQREFYMALLQEKSDIDEDGRGAMKRLLDKKKLERNHAVASTMSLQSVVMQLRKCCNHPYLFGEARNAHGEFETGEHMVQCCGKFQFLDRLLPRLHREGHKVLIFSQMTQLLDILEDYCMMRDFQYCRLDGSTLQEDRVTQMDSFNSDPNRFIFLLSTKAGGVGVNLVAADTVIFYDSDWNPHQDLQAQDRAHRIGQTRPVLIYRLVTRPSIEERIVQRANSKRKLDRVVIQKGAYKGRASIGQTTTVSASELKEIFEEELLSHETKTVTCLISDQELEEIVRRDNMESVRDGTHYKVVTQISNRMGQDHSNRKNQS